MKNNLVKKCADNSWVFVDRNIKSTRLKKLNQAEELMDIGLLDEALELLRELIITEPHLIEAYNDLFLVHKYAQNNFEATAVLEKANNMLLALLPEEMFHNEALLEWGWHENRPFMRLYANLGFEYLSQKKYELALGIFSQLLQWNPDDNQGIRESILICFFELGLLEKALSVCNKYPEDILAGVLYGKPLILLFQRKNEEANELLRFAISDKPKVAQELLKSKHHRPLEMREGIITVGGDDEAYLYWEMFGKYWDKISHGRSILRRLVQDFNK